jgi:signal transduction histidine kinase
MGLSTDSLLRAVIALARDVQRCRSVPELLQTAGSGLEAHGFDVAVVGLDEGPGWLRYATAREPLSGLAHRLGLDLPGGSPGAPPNPLLRSATPGLRALYVADLPASVSSWLDALGGAAAGDLVGWRGRAVAVPLRVAERPWGVVLFMHDQLEEAHVDVLSLFALQLGSVADLAQQYARLEQNSAELTRTQAELVRHERLAAVGELAAVMAHEVRNPLAVIYNSLSTLKRVLRPSPDAELLLTIMDEEAERLNRIVGDLLDFVRQYELVKRPVDVEAVVARALEDSAAALRAASVRVERAFPAELPPFPADADLLTRAVVNLVVNAVHSMPRGGTLTVTASLEPRPEGAWLRLDVRDEGMGLSPTARERMFQPFFTTKATGTGLGLAVVKRILDSHQGEVSVAANPERGTTFSLRLPPEPGSSP